MSLSPSSLLPPNATPFERALERATTRLGAIDTPLDTLLDPATIEADWLPWLAWGLSVDTWDADWTDADKRAAVAGSIALHRVKGTRASVATVLARFDQLATIVEWHEAQPRLAPHTFEIVLPIAGDGVPPDHPNRGRRVTAAFAEAVLREVARVKPLREHVRLVQALAVRSRIGVQAAGRTMLARRDDMTFTDDRTRPWDALLQAETGEPLQGDDAGFLEHQP